MADGLVLNAGSGGSTLATDDAGAAGHVQVVKLALSADGSAVALTADNTNGLLVNVKQVQGSVTAVGAAADGAAASGNPVLVAGFDGTNAQSIATTAAGAVQIHDGSNSITVDNAGTFAVQASEADGANVTLGAKADAKSTATDTTAITAMSVWKQISASVQAIATSIAGTLTVATHAVTQSGTWTVQPGNTANTTAWKVDGSAVTQPVSGTVTASGAAGDVAHDGVDSGNPVKMGAQARSSEPTAVSTNADRVNLIADLVGKLIVLPYSNPENFVSGAITSAMTGTTSTSLLAAPASGLRNYITQITVSNSHATVLTDILIQDGSGGTTLYVIPGPALSGSIITFPTPLRQPTTATAIYCANVTTGANVKVSASGYKGV